MADGFLGDTARTVDAVVDRTAGTMFNGGDQIRWEGMSNVQLAAAITQLKSGPGASAMSDAANALAKVAAGLARLDQTLHDQLQAIGVNWQSDAGDLAQQMTGAAAWYGGTAGQAGGASSAAVDAAAGAFAAAKNTAPDVATLAGPPAQVSFGGVTGHSDDFAQRAAAAANDRQKAIDTMQNYTTSTQSGLNTYRPLPPAPTVGLSATPPPSGGGLVTTVSSITPPPSGPPGAGSGGGSGGGGLPGGGSSGGLPGGGSAGGLPGGGSTGGLPGGGSAGGLPGGGSLGGLPGGPFGGLPGGGSAGGSSGGGSFGGLPGGGSSGGLPGGGLPGGSAGEGAPLAPGPFSGVGEPVASGQPGGIAAAASVESIGSGSSFIEDAALGTAILGGAAGAGIAGASARKDRLVRGRDLVEEGPVEAEDDRYGARQQAARALAELEGEEALAAREARPSGLQARLAGVEAGPAVVEPVPGGADRDDERRHDNRYAVEEDMFGDARTVVPPVLDRGPGAGPAESK